MRLSLRRKRLRDYKAPLVILIGATLRGTALRRDVSMIRLDRAALVPTLLVALVLLVGPALAGSNSWTTNGPNVQGVLWRLALDPTRNATIYAAGASGSGASWTPRVFRSIDTGATWQEISNGIVNIQVNTLTIEPTNGKTLYV